jgi:hypothetical protein
MTKLMLLVLLSLSVGLADGATISRACVDNPYPAQCNTVGQPGTVSASGTAPVGGYHSTATVNFGSIFSSADANCGGTNLCGADANASFTDVITVLDTDGILQASPGVLAVAFSGDGIADSHFRFGSFAGGFTGNQYFGAGCPCQKPSLLAWACRFPAPPAYSQRISLHKTHSTDLKPTKHKCSFSLPCST